MDIEPIKLNPNWKNIRVGEERIAKHLDRFLIREKLLDGPLQFQQWDGSGGESNHFPILLEVASGT